MASSILSMLVCAILMLMASCTIMPGPEPELPPEVNQVAQANTGFALDLYQRLATEEGNLFFSPYSIEAALGMTAAGAKGQTQEQILKTLQLPDNEQTQQGMGALLRWLNWSGQQGKYQLRIANALWGQKDFHWHQDFLNGLQDSYGAGLREVDFAQPEAARQTINAWVEEQTNDKIKDLIPSGMLDRRMRMVLTNAVYFLGDWQKPFNKKWTKEEPFFLRAEDSVPAEMMHQTSRFGYYGDDLVQILEMSYAGGDMSMVVLLPKAKDGLGKLEKGLTAGRLGEWLKQLRSTKVIVSLPKFKMTRKFNLTETLQTMGMRLPFSRGADFSGMTSEEALQVSFVVHKAFVDVNEKGTEAAAATGVGVRATAAIPVERPPVFRADHPFLFLIRDRKHDLILFVGRLADPRN